MPMYIPTALTDCKCNVWPSMTLQVLQHSNNASIVKGSSVEFPCLSAGSASVSAGVVFGLAPTIPKASTIHLIKPVCVNSILLLSSLLIRTPRNPATSSSTLRIISNSHGIDAPSELWRLASSPLSWSASEVFVEPRSISLTENGSEADQESVMASFSYSQHS